MHTYIYKFAEKKVKNLIDFSHESNTKTYIGYIGSDFYNLSFHEQLIHSIQKLLAIFYNLANFYNVK